MGPLEGMKGRSEWSKGGKHIFIISFRTTGWISTEHGEDQLVAVKAQSKLDGAMGHVTLWRGRGDGNCIKCTDCDAQVSG